MLSCLDWRIPLNMSDEADIYQLHADALFDIANEHSGMQMQAPRMRSEFL